MFGPVRSGRFIARVAEAYVRGVFTRRVERLVETLGIASLSKSQVSELAKGLDEMVTDFRNRPLDAAPYTYVWADALTMKVREGRRIVNIACLLAVGVNAEEHREILGVDVATSEDGAGRLAVLPFPHRPGPIRGPTGHLRRPHRPGRRHRGHTGWSIVATMSNPLLRNLLTKVPKSSEAMVATMVRTIVAQPDPEFVWAQHRRVVDHLHQVGRIDAADHLDQAAGEIPRPRWSCY